MLENFSFFNADNKLDVKCFASHLKLKIFLKSYDELFKDVKSFFENSENISWNVLVNIRNGNGYTLLHASAVSGELSEVRWLLDNGVDIKTEDVEGKTAINLVKARIRTKDRTKDRTDVINFLMSRKIIQDCAEKNWK